MNKKILYTSNYTIPNDINSPAKKVILPMHKDTYFFEYGINIDNPINMANEIINLRQENEQLKEQLEANEKIKKEVIEYIKKNSNIYLNIYGVKIGFFINHEQGKIPIELLEILDNKGEDNSGIL